MKILTMNLYTGILFFIAGIFWGCGPEENPVPKVETPPSVTKTNEMKVFMHYMPWFQSKDKSGYWGSHWTMSNQNPEVVGQDGKRQIAAHYYPLIGPYDSRDPDVLEYHLLLMKYSGIDGVLIDWYGIHNVLDYRPNFSSSNLLIEKANEIGLSYAIVYEEYTAENVANKTSKTAIEAAQEDVEYMVSNYFNDPSYIKINDKPLLMTFGPRYFKQEEQWIDIFIPLKEDIVFLPLWHHKTYVGKTADGEFSWVDFDPALSQLNTFYNRKPYLDNLIGSAYPRFHDFYEEGGWGTSYGRVYSNEGETLRNTLQKADDFNLDYLQLVTWNDFGEGTQIEPTVEDQYLFLEIIQDFTGVSYEVSNLELIYEYYQKTKQFEGNTEAQAILENVYQHLINLEVDQAREELNKL